MTYFSLYNVDTHDHLLLLDPLTRVYLCMNNLFILRRTKTLIHVFSHLYPDIVLFFFHF